MTNKLMCNSSSLNYEPDNCTFLLESENVPNLNYENPEFDKEMETNNNSNFEYSDEDFNEIAFVDEFNNNENHEIDLPSVRYFVGYIIYKFLKKFSCEGCKRTMVKSDENMKLPSEYLIKCRNYLTQSEELYLKNPTDYFFELAYSHIKIFEKYFNDNVHKKKILQSIFKICVDSSNRNAKHVEWFTGECQEHKEKVLKFLILVLIRKNCSWQLQKIKDRNNNSKKINTGGEKNRNKNNSKNRRLQILQQ